MISHVCKSFRSFQLSDASGFPVVLAIFPSFRSQGIRGKPSLCEYVGVMIFYPPLEKGMDNTGTQSSSDGSPRDASFKRQVVHGTDRPSDASPRDASFKGQVVGTNIGRGTIDILDDSKKKAGHFNNSLFVQKSRYLDTTRCTN